jgi:hypothetical protein
VATARRYAAGGGRADHSAVVRELLDAIASGGDIAPALKTALKAGRPTTQ